MHLTLLTRAACPLCDRMRAEAQAIAQARGVGLVEIDVDADVALADEWGAYVPVLLLGDPADNVELCHYHYRHDKVAAALPAAPAPATARDIG